MEVVIKEKTNLKHLRFDEVKNCSSAPGSRISAVEFQDGEENIYTFPSTKNGEWELEPVYEFIASCLMTKCDIPHVSYDLINAEVKLNGKIQNLYISRCRNYRSQSQEIVSLKLYKELKSESNAKADTYFEFLKHYGFGRDAAILIALDFIFGNLERNEESVDFVYDPQKKEFSLAPLRGFGRSLLYGVSEDELSQFDVLNERLGVSIFDSTGKHSLKKNLLQLRDSDWPSISLSKKNLPKERRDLGLKQIYCVKKRLYSVIAKCRYKKIPLTSAELNTIQSKIVKRVSIGTDEELGTDDLLLMKIPTIEDIVKDILKALEGISIISQDRKDTIFDMICKRWKLLQNRFKVYNDNTNCKESKPRKYKIKWKGMAYEKYLGDL